MKRWIVTPLILAIFAIMSASCLSQVRAYEVKRAPSGVHAFNGQELTYAQRGGPYGFPLAVIQNFDSGIATPLKPMSSQVVQSIVRFMLPGRWLVEQGSDNHPAESGQFWFYPATRRYERFMPEERYTYLSAATSDGSILAGTISDWMSQRIWVQRDGVTTFLPRPSESFEERIYIADVSPRLVVGHIVINAMNYPIFWRIDQPNPRPVVLPFPGLFATCDEKSNLVGGNISPLPGYTQAYLYDTFSGKGQLIRGMEDAQWSSVTHMDGKDIYAQANFGSHTEVYHVVGRQVRSLRMALGLSDRHIQIWNVSQGNICGGIYEGNGEFSGFAARPARSVR